MPSPEPPLYPASQTLSLSNNRLCQLRDLPTLSSLTHLYIDGNELEDLVGIDQQFPGLITLDVARNRLAHFQGVIDALARLADLDEIDLTGNPCCEGRSDMPSVIANHLVTVSVANKTRIRSPVMDDVDRQREESDEGEEAFVERPRASSIQAEQIRIGDILSGADAYLESCRVRVEQLLRSSRAMIGESLIKQQQREESMSSNGRVSSARQGARQTVLTTGQRPLSANVLTTMAQRWGRRRSVEPMAMGSGG